MLAHRQLEVTVGLRDLDAAARERVDDRGAECGLLADGADGLDGGREVGAVACQHRRIGADLRPPRGRLAVGAQVIVEAPVAHALAQKQEIERVARIGAMRHHAVERCQMPECLPPLASVAANAYARSVAGREHIGAAERLAGPLRLGLDFGITREHRGRLRQPEIDRIAVIVGREAQLEAYRIPPGGALHRMFAALDRAGK